MEKCKATIAFGDDYGDNSTTFHCKLESGHDGSHKEVGIMYSKYSYSLEWSGDMTKEEINESGLDLASEDEEPTAMEIAIRKAMTKK